MQLVVFATGVVCLPYFSSWLVSGGDFLLLSWGICDLPGEKQNRQGEDRRSDRTSFGKGFERRGGCPCVDTASRTARIGWTFLHAWAFFQPFLSCGFGLGWQLGI